VPSEYFRGIHPYSPTPEHFRPHPYSPDFGPPSREFEYVGVPLEPPPLPQNYEPDDEESGPSTAEIIANQSQDYIDERLAEYQATIYQLQGKRGVPRDGFYFCKLRNRDLKNLQNY
jgi:hypothetical protein